eukprot:7801313-Alexandrium_andersonii.AAC.1
MLDFADATARILSHHPPCLVSCAPTLYSARLGGWYVIHGRASHGAEQPCTFPIRPKILPRLLIMAASPPSDDGTPMPVVVRFLPTLQTPQTRALVDD